MRNTFATFIFATTLAFAAQQAYAAKLSANTLKLIENNPNLIQRISPLNVSCVQGKDCANAAKDLAPAVAGEVRAGDAIYAGVCSSCHAAGLLGSPKLGDKAAWAPRIGKGSAVLLQHAIAGFNSMPARGGNATLSDAEVKNAVEYMVSQSK